MLKVRVIQFRVSNEEYDLIAEKAAMANAGPNAYAREIFLSAISGFDAKQAAILREIDKVSDRLLHLEHLVALTAAASTLPLDHGTQDYGVLRQKLTEHFKAASSLAKNISSLVSEGKL